MTGEHNILPLDELDLHSCVSDEDKKNPSSYYQESAREMLASQWNDSHFAACMLEFGRRPEMNNAEQWTRVREWFVDIILQGKRKPVDFEVFAFMSEYRLWEQNQRAQQMVGEILFDVSKVKQLRRMYDAAKKEGKQPEDTIMFEGHELVMAYTRYVLEYLEPRFGIKKSG